MINAIEEQLKMNLQIAHNQYQAVVIQNKKLQQENRKLRELLKQNYKATDCGFWNDKGQYIEDWQKIDSEEL